MAEAVHRRRTRSPVGRANTGSLAELRTEITIDAPPQAVWAVLTDFRGYQGWNPFITDATGQAREGARLTLRLQPPGGRPVTFRPIVLEVSPGRRLRWLGRLGVPGLFDGEHIFTLEESGSGSRLTQRERFRGLLVPLLWKSLNTKTRRGFEDMNRALKAKAEADARA